MELKEAIQRLRDHCNRTIKYLNAAGHNNVPNFRIINDLLKSCDAVFLASDKSREKLEPAWLILYEDKGVPPDYFAGEGAEQAAHRTYKQRLVNWNCHLFKTIELDGEIASGKR